MKLANQQTDFCQAIFSFNEASSSALSSKDKAVGNASVSDAMAIYQNNLHANAQRALAISFPSIETLLGAKLFGELTVGYLQQELKTEFDWGQWGSSFPIWLAQNLAFPEAEILSDLAKFDWLSHQIERAPNEVYDLTTLDLLNQLDASQLAFVLAPGFSAFSTKFPLLSIKQQLNENESKVVELDLDTKSEGRHHFVLWRSQFKTEVEPISSSEYQWLNLVNSTNSIEQALDRLAIDKQLSENFSFTDWLAKVIQQKQLFAIKQLAIDS